LIPYDNLKNLVGSISFNMLETFNALRNAGLSLLELFSIIGCIYMWRENQRLHKEVAEIQQSSISTFQKVINELLGQKG